MKVYPEPLFVVAAGLRRVMTGGADRATRCYDAPPEIDLDFHRVGPATASPDQADARRSRGDRCVAGLFQVWALALPLPDGGGLYIGRAEVVA